MAAAPRHEPIDERPATARALADWASLSASTAARIGLATAIAPVAPRASRAIARRWAALNLRRLGIDVRVDDRSGLGPDPRGVLFVHLDQQTLLAPLVYFAALPSEFSLIVNVEFAALPLIGWMTVAQRAVVIVRQRPEQAKRALASVPARLRAGENFGISIEGRRTRDGALSPFKKGPIVLAIEAECPIVPFMTHGEYALWPRREWRIRPGRIDCVLLPAIFTRGLGYERRDELLRTLRDLAERELRRYETEHASEPSAQPAARASAISGT
jgi:1-acyl-sn-glycerol-3-phosphate acyltransferase